MLPVSKKLNVLSFDAKHSRHWREPMTGVVLRVFKDVVTLRLADGSVLHLVTPAIGNGPHRWVIASFESWQPKRESPCSIRNGRLVLGDVAASMEGALPWWPLEEEPHTIPTKTLLMYLLNRYEQSMKRYLSEQLDSPIVMEKIEIFLKYATLDHARAILGLGSGSTPLGDDALLGYMLARRLLGKPLTPLTELLIDAERLTTALSYEMLIDAHRGDYSETFQRWLKNVLDLKPDDDHSIAALGGNSGAMILYSFYQTCIRILKEEHHENVLAHLNE